MNSHIQLDNEGNFLRYIPEGLPVEWDENNYCTAFALEADGKAGQFNVVPFYAVAEPDYDKLTQGVREINPSLVNDQWHQQFEIYDLEPEQIALNQAAKEATDAKLLNDKIEALWAAADEYTSSYISGVAVGILTVGVIQSLPKALAVSAWSSSVWTEYYVRKELVTLTSVDNHDFSAFGSIPHSVPELQAEIGL